MTDLKDHHYLFVDEFASTMKGLAIHYRKYIIDILKRFNRIKDNTTSTSMKANSKLTKTEDDQKFDNTLYRGDNKIH